MDELIISVSGLRGVVGQSLTPQVAARYTLAFAESAGPGPIVVTRDGRPSGPMLAAAIGEAMAQAGRQCLYAGVAATPTTGILVRDLQAAGGIQISASHNPAQYNGLKLFSNEGRVISAAAGEQVLAQYRRMAAPLLVGSHKFEDGTDTSEGHLRRVLAIVDVERVRMARHIVLLDSNHGAGSILGRSLLDSLGCHVEMMGETPDGNFAHPPEPTAENLASVLAAVPAGGAAIGFCQDPDADRLAIIDENGRYLGEEFTLALCVDHVLRRSPGPIVTNCSTSRVSEDLARRYGVPLFRSAVGEANVTEAMLTHNAVLGGEGNGGVIDPRVGLVRDSFVGMALVLDAMSALEVPISNLADELPRYAMVKTKITLAADKVTGGLEALAAHFAGAEVSRLDGLRLDWPGSWLLVRASNTEPIVRAIAEAATESEARELCDQAARVLSAV